MTKKRIAEVYRFLAAASMKRLQDEEKIKLIRLLRQMKPVANELSEAINDAMQKAIADGMERPDQFALNAVADIAGQNVEVITATMTEDAFERLALSNDWNFGQIDELQEVLVIKE